MSHGHEHKEEAKETHKDAHHDEHGDKGSHGGHGGGHAHHHPMSKNPEETRAAIEHKRNKRKYHLPVIGHFADRSVRFKSIMQASDATGIHYSLIFEACIGKIYKAKNVIWEFERGNHYIKYKAFYVNARESYLRPVGFNG